MAYFYREPNRRQGYLLPVDMSDWVSDTDMVHLILEAVERMDLSAFETPGGTHGVGAPGFAPSMMVSLLIYAYANGVCSSRKIERLCGRDAGFRLIVGFEVPDHSVIARFRQRHRQAFESLFVEVLKLCHEMGLVRLGVVALDGTKVHANASLSANRTVKSLAKEVAAMVSEAEEMDASEAAVSDDIRDDGLPSELRHRGERLARLQRCLTRLQREADAQAVLQQQKLDARAAEEVATGKVKRGRKPKSVAAVVNEAAKANPTDPDSRVMKSSRGWVQGYNAQAMVTRDQIIVAPDVTSQANDVQQLQPMLDKANTVVRTVLGETACLGTVLMDAGYWSEANAALETADCELMIATRKDWKQRKAMREAPVPRGRIPNSLSSGERMERKLLTQRGRKFYRLRGQTVEPVFGQTKQTQGAERFMVRGEQAAKGEWNLHCSVHNLKKLHREVVRQRIEANTG